MKTGKASGLYRRLCNPSGHEYADFLSRHGRFYSMGEGCHISPKASITDQAYMRIGNNVRISSGCSIFGHDGAVNMINRAYGLWLDSVGKIDIGDNVFIAHRAIIQPGVTIGSNVIVCAGSVVNRDVEDGMIVAGIPARPVSTVSMHVELLKSRNAKYPWRDLIEARQGGWNPDLEKELLRLRVDFFYPAEGGEESDSAGSGPDSSEAVLKRAEPHDSGGRE